MQQKLHRFRTRVSVYIVSFVVFYGGFSATIGQLPSHIMGGHYGPYQMCYVTGAIVFFSAYLIHFNRITLLRGALVGLVVSYISGLLGYLIAVGVLDSQRFYRAITTTDPFVFIYVVLGTPLFLLSWLPGGLAGATAGAVIQLIEGRRAGIKNAR